MSNIIQFGEQVEGYDIPVLNEREIRASAGILFLLIFISLMLIMFKGNFLMVKYIITLFLTDMLIRVFINPKYSPTLIIGRLIVRNQTPEYVGAPQKKFAWKIGIFLAAAMFVLMVIVNSYSIISGLSCMVCLIFLFFESAFGICIGCKFYAWFYKDKVQYCPGEICDVNNKHDIQKTSKIQFVIILGFVLYILALVFVFNDLLSIKPQDLWEILDSAKSQ